MPSREDKIYEEAAALWRQLYGDPPPAVADGSVILDMIFSDQPATDYDHIATPHLRPANITFPKY